MLRFFSAAVAACLLLAGLSRADNIDLRLREEAPKVLEHLRAKGYHNVGILHFRVKKGTLPVSFKVGPLNSNLASRVENVLVLLNETTQPVGIIHDASQVAAAKKLPAFTFPKGRERLFEEQFPLAWGSEMVKADAFLTGLVEVPADMKKADVTIQVFDRQTKGIDQVVKFAVPMDRSILSDLSQSFVVAKRQLTRGADLELVADEDASERDKKNTTPVPPTPNLDNPLEFHVQYDGSRQEVAPDPQNPGEMRVAEPKQGQKISFILKNASAEKIGVVFKINGKNTVFEETEEPSRCTKWILDPGAQYEITGFQMDDKTEIPFKVLSDEESLAAYSDQMGWLHLYVFRSGPEGAGDNGKMQISYRGLSPAESARLPVADTLVKRQQQLRSAMNKSRGLMAKDEGATRANEVRRDTLPNPQQVATLAVRYYKPKD